MRLIDADSVLKGIEELKQSPWFNRGKEVVSGDPGFQHIGYIERKEAVEVVRDLCIRKEPTVGGWISVKDRLPEKEGQYLCWVHINKVHFCYQIHLWYSGTWRWANNNVLYWMPLPEPPKEEEQNA